MLDSFLDLECAWAHSPFTYREPKIYRYVLHAVDSRWSRSVAHVIVNTYDFVLCYLFHWLITWYKRCGSNVLWVVKSPQGLFYNLLFEAGFACKVPPSWILTSYSNLNSSMNFKFCSTVKLKRTLQLGIFIAFCCLYRNFAGSRSELLLSPWINCPIPNSVWIGSDNQQKR